MGIVNRLGLSASLLLATLMAASGCTGQPPIAPTNITTLAPSPTAGAPVQQSRDATAPHATVLTPILTQTPTLAAASTVNRSAPVPTSIATTSAGATPFIQTTVLLGDNGKTITLKTGDRFLLNLGTDYTWMIVVGDPTIVAGVPGQNLGPGAQGMYLAARTGTTTLTATGNMVCPPDKMCIASVKTFQVSIVVR